MDFEQVLKKLITAFESKGISYALMGGMAVGAWGVARTTADIDFLVLKDDCAKLRDIMKSLGYECRYQTENVSQYVSPLEIFGEVDFLHAFREISRSMLQRAESRKLFDNALSVNVLQVEDIVGLKVQAIANDPGRENRDISDIEELVKIYGKRMDWKLLEEYFSLFGLDDLLLKIRSRHAPD